MKIWYENLRPKLRIKKQVYRFYISLLFCSINLCLDLCYFNKSNLKSSCLKKKFRILIWFWVHVLIKYKKSRGQTLVLRANSVMVKVITIFLLTLVMQNQLQLTNMTLFWFYFHLLLDLKPSFRSVSENKRSISHIAYRMKC